MVIIKKILNIRGKLAREEIRRKVVSEFLNEPPGRGRDTEYRYYVETLPDGRKIFLKRPGIKFDFDFKVVAEKDDKLWPFGGTHGEIKEDLIKKSKENPQDFKLLLQTIKRVCDGDDVDSATASCSHLKFSSGLDIEFLLKVLKWMFVMEDVYYWDYEGRYKLMKALEKNFV